MLPHDIYSKSIPPLKELKNELNKKAELQKFGKDSIKNKKPFPSLRR